MLQCLLKGVDNWIILPFMLVQRFFNHMDDTRIIRLRTCPCRLRPVLLLKHEQSNGSHR